MFYSCKKNEHCSTIVDFSKQITNSWKNLDNKQCTNSNEHKFVRSCIHLLGININYENQIELLRRPIIQVASYDTSIELVDFEDQLIFGLIKQNTNNIFDNVKNFFSQVISFRLISCFH